MDRREEVRPEDFRGAACTSRRAKREADTLKIFLPPKA